MSNHTFFWTFYDIVVDIVLEYWNFCWCRGGVPQNRAWFSNSLFLIISKNIAMSLMFFKHFFFIFCKHFSKCCENDYSILRILTTMRKLVLRNWLRYCILWLFCHFQLRLLISFLILIFIIIIFRISKILNIELGNHIYPFAWAALTFAEFPINSKWCIISLWSKMFSTQFALLTFLSIDKCLARRILSAVRWIDLV